MMGSHDDRVNQRPALTGAPWPWLFNLDMDAFWYPIDPAFARYVLIGVVVLALLRRLKHPRWCLE